MQIKNIVIYFLSSHLCWNNSLISRKIAIYYYTVLNNFKFIFIKIRLTKHRSVSFYICNNWSLRTDNDISVLYYIFLSSWLPANDRGLNDAKLFGFFLNYILEPNSFCRRQMHRIRRADTEEQINRRNRYLPFTSLLSLLLKNNWNTVIGSRHH